MRHGLYRHHVGDMEDVIPELYDKNSWVVSGCGSSQSNWELRAISMSKVIISCAVTGAVHTPSMSPYLPITPEQIADQAIDAAKAGASILHLHARDPATG